MERRALYNSLRLNWILDSKMPVESWQVEDYRSLPLEELFLRLNERGVRLDKQIFHNLANQCDSPEELTDLKADGMEDEDKIYLLLFEVWRRLLPEKQSLSIFCDELDHQIQLYDSGQATSIEGIEDSLANLQKILDENADSGLDPKELFETVVHGCANDVESFICDFIQTQIDHENGDYAQELIEAFTPYVKDGKWLEFLKAETLFPKDREAAMQIIEQLLRGKNKSTDLEFNLELLSFLAKTGEERHFKSVFKLNVPLLEVEDDFFDLANISADFFHYCDKDNKEAEVLALLESRPEKAPHTPFLQTDPQIKILQKILNS